MRIARFILILSLACAGSGPAQDVAQQPAAPAVPMAWLGVHLAKPDAMVTAHLPELPSGFGFVVTSVDAGGPAAQAGLAAMDVIWKLNDQILVNESQLAALLRLHAPGTRVLLGGFRKGKAESFSVVLGQQPQRTRESVASMLDAAILPGSEAATPMRVVRVNQRVASYHTQDGELEVSRSGETYQVKVTAPDGRSIFEGNMDLEGRIDGLSADWVRRAHALRRGLDHHVAAQSVMGMASDPDASPQGSTR